VCDWRGNRGRGGGIIGRLASASASLKSLDENVFHQQQQPEMYLSKYGEAICQDPVLSRFAFLRLLVMEGIYFIDSYKG
jgi:hypothetical protein